MQYYQVIKDGVFDHKTGYTTIQNELVTKKERKRCFPTLTDACFQEITLPKTNTFHSFGARFAIKQNQEVKQYDNQKTF